MLEVLDFISSRSLRFPFELVQAVFVATDWEYMHLLRLHHDELSVTHFHFAKLQVRYLTKL